MAERVFLGGLTNTEMIFESDGTTHIRDHVDAEPILDYAAACRNNRYSGMSPEGTLQHVAEIPIPLVMQWAREAGLGNDQLMGQEMSIIIEKKLQDPQYAKLLAAPTLRDPHIIMRGLK